MDMTQEYGYLETERGIAAEVRAWEEDIEPIIANTKNAVVTGGPRFYDSQGDNDGWAG